MAIGNAANAGLLAVRILASHEPSLLDKMVDYQVSRSCCSLLGSVVQCSVVCTCVASQVKNRCKGLVVCKGLVCTQ